MTGAADQWSDSEVSELRKVFFMQAYEIVEDLQEDLLKIEAGAANPELLNTVKRNVHTLKGDAYSVGLNAVGSLCHRMEDVLARQIPGKSGEDCEALDLLLGCVDAVQRGLAAGEAGREADNEDETRERLDRFLVGRPDGFAAASLPAAALQELSEYQELQVRDALQKGLRVYDVEAEFHPQCSERSVAALMLVRRLEGSGSPIACIPDPESAAIGSTDVITIVVAAGADSGAIEAGARIAGITRRIAVRERRGKSGKIAPLQPPAGGPAAKSELLRVEASRVDAIMDLVGEIIIGRSMIDQINREIDSGSSAADVGARLAAASVSMERAASDLQKSVMKMRMVPVYSVFRKFPRIVRDLSAEKGKRVRVDLTGNETELDRRIVDALSEPLLHLVRNAVDHGIESPGERRSAGKPEEAVISLRAYHEASRIVIEAADDGRGIESGRLKRKAVEQGYLSEADAENLSAAEALNLIFLPGLSTAPAVSETSGRGIGMDAVRSAIQGLKGSIELETIPGRGTQFRMRMPLTLAIINALLFEVGPRLYAVPVAVIAEVTRTMGDEIVTIEGRKTLLLRDQLISLLSLEELFGITGAGGNTKYVLILAIGGRKIGLLIDRLMWQQELVIKSIDDRHLQTEFVAGGSILGSGKVVFILDVNAIIRRAVQEEKKKGVAAV